MNHKDIELFIELDNHKLDKGVSEQEALKSFVNAGILNDDGSYKELEDFKKMVQYNLESEIQKEFINKIRLLPGEGIQNKYHTLKTNTMINAGDKVIHNTHGGGTVTAVSGSTATVRFNIGVTLPVDISTLQKPLFS